MAEQDLSRPYVGYRSAGRRPESQQDRTASANAPLSALRGYVAGTLGLPGDIEGLGRMLIPGVSEQSYLPDSEYFRKVLPMRELEQTPIGSAFTEVGGLAGGAGLMTAGKVAGKAGKAGARYAGEQLNRAILDSSGPLARLVPEAAKPMYVVKPKGGNWLAAQPERITGPLRNSRIEEADYNQFVRDQADLGTGYQDWLKGKVDQSREFAFIPAIDTANMFLRETKQPLIPIDPVNSWIDKTLKSYVRNEMATPDDPLRAMAEQWAAKKPELLAQADAKLKALNEKTQKLMAERGVPEEFLTRHRQDVIAAEKARDLIAARRALHARMPEGGRWEPEELAGKRSGAGFPAKGMGVSEEAKNWEQLSDEAIGVGSAGKRFGSGYGGQVLEDNPWLAKVPPETPTYTGYGLNELGFEHLGDELRNALNPNSGLPAELLLKYSDLPKKTVPDIVNRVADIDAWRATQKAEADLAKANNAATVVYKEYPEQGLAWKQIKTPEMDENWQVPDRYSIVKPTPSAETFAIKDNETGKYITSGLESEEAAAKHLHKTLNKETLQDALKYEGDIMKHCVGGYCPSVESGQTEIYSLRDAKGKPHVTIEVEKNQNPYPYSSDPKAYGKLSPAEKAQYGEHVRQWRRRNPDVDELTDEQVAQALMEAGVPPQPDRILQIKGVENKKPEAEYMPQIQDFVKSGNWSEVKDLKNAGLIRADAIRGAGWDNIGLDQKYLTEQEYDDLLLKNLQPPAQGMAHGGPVSLDQLAAHYDKGGSVNSPATYDPSLIDEIVSSIDEPTGYAGGGIVKGLAKLGKKMVADSDVLPAAEREANKAKFLESSEVKERVYHGTGNLESLKSFDPTMTGKGTDQLGSGFYFTTNPEEASGYATTFAPPHRSGASGKIGGDSSPGVIAAHLSIKKPIKIKGSNLSDSDAILSQKHAIEMIKRAPNIRNVENTPLQDWFDLSRTNGVTESMLKDVAKNYQGASLNSLSNDFYRDSPTEFRSALRDVIGYDGVMQDFGDGRKHYVAWFPEQIKSAIGNRGTYDIKDADITKARGGSVRMAQGGSVSAYDADLVDAIANQFM